MAYDGANGRSYAHISIDGGRYAAFMTGCVDFKPMGERLIVAAVARVSENAGYAVSDCPLDIRDGGYLGLAVVESALNADVIGEILGIWEGTKEHKSGWSAFLRHLVERGLKGVRPMVADVCRDLVEGAAEYLPDAR